MIGSAASLGYSGVLNIRGINMMQKVVTFRGCKYTLCNPGPYYRANNWNRKKHGPSNLHRAVWTYYRGEIPEGFNVHHIDGDRTNNKLSNLELIGHADHSRMHAFERHKNGTLRPPGQLCRDNAADELRHRPKAWFKKNGKAAWKTRVWHDLICTECGKPYQSPYPNKSKFCHLNCKMMTYRRKWREERGGIRL